jgi:hypothetical protein
MYVDPQTRVTLLPGHVTRPAGSIPPKKRTEQQVCLAPRSAVPFVRTTKKIKQTKQTKKAAGN